VSTSDEGAPSASRRQFLLGGVAAATAGIAALASRWTNAPALLGLTAKSGPRIAGGFVNESATAGHRLRDGASWARPTPRRTRRVPLVIVGGGIAGLSAAWQLERHGFRDFVLLELERETGGNARGGENAVSRFPWAAHYVPVPGPRAVLARALFTELGILTASGWDERTTCFAPHERLFVHGEWQPGLEAELLGSRVGRDELHHFEERIAAARLSGEFTIPMALGARPDSPLDRFSFAEWLARERLRSPAMRWYADYAMRDDYGALARDTSAWAGLHYFASREPDDSGPLTWPEGNAWIARRLTAKLARFIETGSMVHAVSPDGRGWRVRAGDEEIRCDDVIFAAPSFVAPYVVQGMRAAGFTYSPWLVANLTLSRWPRERGVAPAWDNVLRRGGGLGYVVATHQSVRTRSDGPTVWTYYHALATSAPADARRALSASRWEDWVERILAELEVAHPDIRRCVTRVDAMRLGHAMVRPTVGFLMAEARVRADWAPRGIHLANSDVSGLSLFEEAQYRGAEAANAVLSRHTGGRRSS
jgi:glycine/D-amino acid oxidase-like deaminating enzyme